MLTIIVPVTSLTSLTTSLRIKVVTAVVGSILISSPTPSFAESTASKDMATITSLNKVKRPVMLQQTSEVLSDRVDKTENDIIEIKGNIKDLRQDVNEVKIDLRGTIVVFILFVIRSEVKDGEMKKEMKTNKEEADAKMAKADTKMDKNFIITTCISATSLLISLVMTLAAKK